MKDTKAIPSTLLAGDLDGDALEVVRVLASWSNAAATMPPGTRFREAGQAINNLLIDTMGSPKAGQVLIGRVVEFLREQRAAEKGKTPDINRMIGMVDSMRSLNDEELGADADAN